MKWKTTISGINLFTVPVVFFLDSYTVSIWSKQTKLLHLIKRKGKLWYFKAYGSLKNNKLKIIIKKRTVLTKKKSLKHILFSTKLPKNCVILNKIWHKCSEVCLYFNALIIFLFIKECGYQPLHIVWLLTTQVSIKQHVNNFRPLHFLTKLYVNL